LNYFFFFFFFFFLLLETTIIEFTKIKSRDFVYKKKKVKVDIVNLFTYNFNLVAFLLFISTTTRLLDKRTIFLTSFLTLTNLFITTTTTTTIKVIITTMQRRENT